MQSLREWLALCDRVVLTQTIRLLVLSGTLEIVGLEIRLRQPDLDWRLVLERL
jgi:hypothetical protein